MNGPLSDKQSPCSSTLSNERVGSSLPLAGFVRLSQILGDPKKQIPPIIPVSKSTWWAGVQSGRYPQPVKLSERCTAWRVEDIQSLIEQAANGDIV